MENSLFFQGGISGIIFRPKYCSIKKARSNKICTSNRRVILRCYAINKTNTDRKMRFQLAYHVHYGESIGMLGNIKELGLWKPDKVVKMSWTPGDVWRMTCDIPTDFDYKTEEIQYKYVKLNGENEILEWQPGSNLKLMLERMIEFSKPDQLVIVNDEWLQEHKKDRFKSTSENVESDSRDKLKGHARNIKDYEFTEYEEEEGEDYQKKYDSDSSDESDGNDIKEIYDDRDDERKGFMHKKKYHGMALSVDIGAPSHENSTEYVDEENEVLKDIIPYSSFEIMKKPVINVDISRIKDYAL